MLSLLSQFFPYNWIGVLAAAFTSFIFSFIYFSAIFGRLFSKYSNFTPKDYQNFSKRSFPSLLKHNFFTEILTSIAVCICILYLRAETLEEVLKIVMGIWLAFILPSSVAPVLWENEHVVHSLISLGHRFGALSIQGVIFFLFANLNRYAHELELIEPIAA